MYFSNESHRGSSRGVKLATETGIDNLYSNDEFVIDIVSGVKTHWDRSYIELVRVDNDLYVIENHEYENLYGKGIIYCHDLKENMEYINKENELTPIKVL